MRATPIPGPTRHNAFHQHLRPGVDELPGDHFRYECATDDVCTRCDGTGRAPMHPQVDCQRCYGSGRAAPERGL